MPFSDKIPGFSKINNTALSEFLLKNQFIKPNVILLTT